MSQKLYELALEIQGRLDGSFASAMKSAQGDIKTLEAETKAWQDRQKKVGGIDAAYIRAREGARKLSGELVGLKRQQDAISRYQGQVQAISQTAKAYKDAQKQVKALSAAYAKDKTKENKKAMQDAAKQAKTLEKQYAKNQAALKKMGTSLKEAGINTKNLGAEQANLARKLAEAEDRQNRFTSAAERIAHIKANWASMTGKVKEYARTLKWAIGIGASLAAGTFMLSKSAAERANQAAKAAKKARTDAETYQKIEYIASLSGVSDIEKALVTMNRNISDFATTGKGKAADVIKRLHFDTKNFLDMNADEKLMAIAKAFQKITDESTRTSIAKAFFGTQEAEMREFLRNTPEQIRKFMKEAEELGWVVKNDNATAAEGFIDNVDRFQKAIQGLKNTIGIELMPIVDDIVKSLTEWVKQNRELVSEKVKEWVQWLIDNLPGIWDEFKKGTNAIGNFLKIIGDGIGILGGFSTTLKTLLGLWASKKVLSMGKWITDTGKTMLGSGATGGGAAMAAETTAGTAATTAAGGMAAKGAAAGTGAKVAGMLPRLAGIFGALTLFSEAAKRTGAVELANKTGEKFGVKDAYNASDIEWAIASKAKAKEEQPKEDPLAAMYPELAKFRAQQALQKTLPSPQAVAKMTPPPTPSGDKDKPSPLPDEQVKPVFDIVSITKEIEEQSRQRVSQEDFNHYGTVIASYLQGNEQAIRDLPERLRPIVEKLRPVQSPIVEHHARGGFVSTPTISTLAERGGEMVVPTADADRGLGISRLMEAARKLGVETLSAPEWDIPKLDIPTPAAPEWDIPKLNIPTPAAPEWNIPQLNIPAPAAPEWDIPKLDIPAPAAPEWNIPKLNIPAPAAPKWDIPRLLKSSQETGPGTTSKSSPVSMPNITFSPTFNITGSDAQDIAGQVETVTRQTFAEMMREYSDEMRRVDYEI